MSYHWYLRVLSHSPHLVLHIGHGIEFSNGRYSSFQDDESVIDVHKEQEKQLFDATIQAFIPQSQRISVVGLRPNRRFWFSIRLEHQVEHFGTDPSQLPERFDRYWGFPDSIADYLFVGGQQTSHDKKRLLSQVETLEEYLLKDLEKQAPFQKIVSEFDRLFWTLDGDLFVAINLNRQTASSVLATAQQTLNKVAAPFKLPVPNLEIPTDLG
ncbi:MAG: hypothetical protein AAF490_19850 [Chloroflexota bacterium]